MKFQKSRYKILGPGQINCPAGQSRDRVTERFAEKKLEVCGGQEVDSKLALCLAEKWAAHIPGYDSKSVVSRQGPLVKPHPNLSALVRPHLEFCALPRTTLPYRRESKVAPQRRLASESTSRKSLSVLGLFNI